jgi:hypothetical protein
MTLILRTIGFVLTPAGMLALCLGLALAHRLGVTY